MIEKLESLIVNALLNIKTNLNFNLKLVAKIYGGTFDSSLPGFCLFFLYLYICICCEFKFRSDQKMYSFGQI